MAIAPDVRHVRGSVIPDPDHCDVLRGAGLLRGTGLHALLGIAFPLITPPTIWYGHRWHLAIEFRNWIEAAAATGA